MNDPDDLLAPNAPAAPAPPADVHAAAQDATASTSTTTAPTTPGPASALASTPATSSPATSTPATSPPATSTPAAGRDDTRAIDAEAHDASAGDDDDREDDGQAAPGAPADLAPGTPFVVEEWVFGTVEALCFVSGEPLTPPRVRDVLASELPTMDGKAGMAPPTLHQVKEIFAELVRRWSDPTRATGQGFRLVEIDGGLAFRTVAGQARFVRRMQLGKPQKLSRAALETLAVIAYRQPVTKPQIEEIRGVDCGGALKALLDKRLVRILGKAEDVGRPLLYGTSRSFLEFFHLQSLNDLPTLKQLHELEGGAPVAAPADAGGPAVVMDLFQPGSGGVVSAETEEESADALDALERALGAAKKVARTASTLVFGIEVPDEEAKPGGDPEQ